jgi:anthranilate/para-aminobenzoate synthase component II
LILVIDNYDSFVYNLAQYLGELGWQPAVHRNDSLTLTQIEAMAPSHIVISPGPPGASMHRSRLRRPDRAGSGAGAR